MPALDREEYIEQAHLFKMLLERLPLGEPIQDVLRQARHEILSTTRLPWAIDFMVAELLQTGLVSEAMGKLSHYFHPFQTYVMREAENERGRFDIRIALEILLREIEYRAEKGTPQGLFMYQLESISRNRLKYDHGLDAMARDPMYNKAWQDWIVIVRRQIGLVELADMIYVRSNYFRLQQQRLGHHDEDETPPLLFGEKEGKIAFANRHKDPFYLFSALQRHLGYPAPPRPKRDDDATKKFEELKRRFDQLEIRVKLVEAEQKGGIDLNKLFGPHASKEFKLPDLD